MFDLFDSLDVITSSIKTRTEQPSFEAFLKQSFNNCNIDDELITYLEYVDSDELDTNALIVEGVALEATLKNCEIKRFRDMHKNIIGNCECQKNLIPNMVKLIELLLVSPKTSCTPE